MSQNEELLRYYQNELTYLRRKGAEFARSYRRVARRLELGEGECPDPHVERLMESFAFLTARLQHDLDGELPEITTALLGVLYPQFTAPLPSCAVARFDPDPAQGQKLAAGHTFPRGTTLFATTPQDHTCRFRTCYDVTLWPLEVESAAVEGTGRLDFLDSESEAVAVLRLKVRCTSGALADLSLGRLRFYLKGDPSFVAALHELLFCNVRGVALLPDGEARPVTLPSDALTPVGFGEDEEVLPYPPQSHPGYRLLQEYFAFPEKFHFFDLKHLDRLRRGKTLDIIFMLDRAPERQVADKIGADSFCLGCTPVVNLFGKTSEPIRLDHRTIEYPLVADKRRERSTEIHSIRSVSVSSNDGADAARFEPFYSYTHAMDDAEHKAFWHARRAPSLTMPGTDVFLSFLDLDFRPASPPAQTVYAHTLCTNRELATQLPAGARLSVEQEASPLKWVSCVSKPTYPVWPPLRGQALWRLVSHLSLNHLSLSGGRDGLGALREILTLYSAWGGDETEQEIAGLVGMECEEVVGRVGAEAWRGFCRGTRVTLDFNEECYVGTSALLFSEVLSQFFALYASVNSFVEVAVKSRQRKGVWKRWQPTAGVKVLL